MAAGTIEVAPLAYMRGRTLNDAFIILDEAQNTSPEQMKMFLTRLGFGAKMVVTGDVTQVDLPSGTQSGLRIVRDILDGIEDVHFAELTSSDVVRHRLVSEIVDAYSRWDATAGRRGVAPGVRPRRPPPAAAALTGGVVSVEVNNESGVEADESEIVALARHVLGQMRVNPQAELSIVLVDESAMEQLHVQWMDEPGPTDVLSFPMDELRPGVDGEESAPGLLGDVVLCPQVAARQAQQAGHTTQDELLLLTTHGILHLLGYDHAEPDEEREMFGLQRRLLLTFLAGREADRDAGKGAP